MIFVVDEATSQTRRQPDRLIVVGQRLMRPRPTAKPLSSTQESGTAVHAWLLREFSQRFGAGTERVQLVCVQVVLHLCCRWKIDQEEFRLCTHLRRRQRQLAETVR